MRIIDTIRNITQKMSMLSFMTLAACCLLSQSLAGQDMNSVQNGLKHEVTLGYGLGTIVSFNDYSDDDNEFTKGNIHLQYLYNVNRHIGLGVLVDYSHSYIPTREVCFDYDEKNRFIGGHLKDIKNGTEWFTISPTARFYWFNNKHFAMNSRFGIGLLFSAGYDKRKRRIMPNLSPLSIEFGSTRFRFCTELLAIGSYGVFNGGLKYSF